ncbi:ATP-binding cassette domain-containing protein [Microbispora cellulosiformans]|uniref:ATP-binding cassette domain-containing protein n=1 Tax=Microbispora cellulosiformans TaxID=2614688 RepID=A0A5J5JX58_9ACTN|nr:ATP-binding cassette domain-containing protein [Microbispora cellulosiformans]KAA9375543.1 ATP-binding cassette domain-containing protein [Microbispora cellulosiformans]
MIQATGLTHTFTVGGRTVEAVRGVDFEVSPGEIIGFLGPNGAGKTTTLRILTTMLKPTSGRATVAGVDVDADPAGVRRRIGYVAQAGGTDGNCRVAEELILQARLYGIGKRDAERRAAELCERLDLTGLADRPIRTLSGGQRRRTDIALGLVHEPRLVFLDEPSVGLDPQSRSDLWTHIRRLRDELGTTVFLTTHYLDEADTLCDRILVMNHGRVIAEGTPDALKRRISGDVVSLTLGGDADRAKAVLAECPGLDEIAVSGQTVRLTARGGEQALVWLMRAADQADLDLRSVNIARPTLDDVFLALTGSSLNENHS